MYGDIIKEQDRRGFIEKIENKEFPADRPVHYIPHHPIAKESSTTPIRIVFDCSCKDGSGNPSLNDCLESHPPITNDITGILLRFRAKKYATTSDLEKAFLQIQLDEKDRDATRFLWQGDPTDTSSSLVTHHFKLILFGATCSPFILSATLFKHFKENQGPLSATLLNGLYVDNILTSLDDEDSVMEYYKESRESLRQGEFSLRSWNSNSKRLREIARNENTLDSDERTKILGMQLKTKNDTLLFQSNNLEEYEKEHLKKMYFATVFQDIRPFRITEPGNGKSKNLHAVTFEVEFGMERNSTRDYSK